MFKQTMAGAAGWLLSALLATALAQGQPVQVEGAWARATVAGQHASGAFMTLTAAEGARVVGVSSPVAGAAQIHEMVMQGDVMRMREIDGLPLPPGQPVTLKPGGLHVMLLDLKAPLTAGTNVPLELRVVDRQGSETRLNLQVPVRALNAPPPAAGHGAMHGG